MNINFDDLFPLISYELIETYESHCPFFFSSDSPYRKQCLDYIQKKKQEFLDSNDFALKKCNLENKNKNKDCCKKYSKNNDTAYRICMGYNEQKNFDFARQKYEYSLLHSNSNTNSSKFFTYIIIISIIILFVILVFFYFIFYTKNA